MATRKYVLLAILLVGNAGLPISQDPPSSSPPDALDKVVSKQVQADCGLQKLNAKERNNLAVLMAQGARQRVANQVDEEAAMGLGWTTAQEHLESAGYTLLHCAVVQANNTTFFVVGRRGLSSATKDIPIGFPELTFRDGSYWCRSQALGGIRSILVGQREYRFTLAEWKDL